MSRVPMEDALVSIFAIVNRASFVRRVFVRRTFQEIRSTVVIRAVVWWGRNVARRVQAKGSAAI
jgi:hypothetical protein